MTVGGSASTRLCVVLNQRHFTPSCLKSKNHMQLLETDRHTHTLRDFMLCVEQVQASWHEQLRASALRYSIYDVRQLYIKS
jgi:hypothetical protein